MDTQEDFKQVIEVSEVIDTPKRDSNPIGMYVALYCTSQLNRGLSAHAYPLMKRNVHGVET